METSSSRTSMPARSNSSRSPISPGNWPVATGLTTTAGARAERLAQAAEQNDYDTVAMSDSTPSFATPYRTHTCGELRASDSGVPARLAGWVHRRRDHGQLIFIDLRDRYGITQVIVDATQAPLAHACLL